MRMVTTAICLEKTIGNQALKLPYAVNLDTEVYSLLFSFDASGIIHAAYVEPSSNGKILLCTQDLSFDGAFSKLFNALGVKIQEINLRDSN